MAQMPRVQAVVLPILRAALVPDKAQKVGTWVEDIDFRQFPLVNIRQLGGLRHETRPNQLSLPVIEMTVFHSLAAGGTLAATETLYDDALEALFDAVKRQTQTPDGYLHSARETMGKTQFSSLFQDSWRVQGLIQLGVRPPRQS